MINDKDELCCDYCGKVIEEDDELFTINPYDNDLKCACENCIETIDCAECAECNELVSWDRVALIDDEQPSFVICKHCSNDWFKCPVCGTVERKVNGEYDSRSKKYYCSSCMFHPNRKPQYSVLFG